MIVEQRKRRSKVLALAAGILSVLTVAGPAFADDAALFDMSLEQLLAVEITSVSKRSQPLSDTAAAVHVITGADIRTAGARSIAEALKLAPGLQVAQIDGVRWAISARGFNGRFANKLLVLVDGRSVYTSTFSGVYWETLDTLIDDIDRIEVVRGPGGATWGANAVNGVINIITKNSADTHGSLVSGSLDSLQGNSAAWRFGGQAGDDASFRLFVKSASQDASAPMHGIAVSDSRKSVQLGGRYDIDTGRSTVSISAEHHRDDLGESLVVTELSAPYASIRNFDNDVDTSFINARWSTNLANGGQLEVRGILDHAKRESAMIDEESTTREFDAMYRPASFGQHNMSFGLSISNQSFEFAPSEFATLWPLQGNNSRLSAHIVDDISLRDGRGTLTLGAKFEKNERLPGGGDLMPTARLNWRVQDNAVFWASITQSVRTPSHADVSLMLEGIGPAIAPLSGSNPLPVPSVIRLKGDAQSNIESVTAYESGVRWQPNERHSFDVAAFYNDYSDLRAASMVVSSCEPSGELLAQNPACIASSAFVRHTVTVANSTNARSFGIEAVTKWAVSENLKLDLSYSYIDTQLATDSAVDVIPDAEHQLLAHIAWTPTPLSRIDFSARYVDEIEGLAIPARTDMNLRWAWQVQDQLELSVAGQQLGRADQIEFRSVLGEIPTVAIERRVVAQLRWSY